MTTEPVIDDLDDESAEPVRPRRKGIYILPNLFTLGALFGGFYAIVMAMNGRFENACIGIFCAAVLDSLDGRVARMTNTQSAFGEQMDSLSDMVSFGAAPALIVYEWALKGLGKAGWIAAFVYCACAALRLARFNTNIGIVDKRYFQGLPSPAAAALVIGFVWVMDDAGFKGVSQIDWLAWLALGFTLYAGLTMVTNVPFYSFKDVSFKRTVPFIVIVLIALGIALINVHPPMVLFALFVVYGLSGYVVYAVKKSKGSPVSVIATSTDEPDEEGLHR
ncbi:CDP-diacylglycerol--serine O-phosphatidyltransferase [Sphaerotilus microaerophilus]|jgi:CDP-diacylglycerol--serine O-phosphatidyltransferase|uniref:CDP-diacylglycerol--serine O-phosphatidyltransferase n=1 Tax=Sphaerotilus microaerophilus TaxID=2914710 RepID=A0ABM7YKY3_9BURK|nr:CDP-diacylglycerol--serine O-phosphatidyltransferase [Sphaerotilus sp. FB-5]BDI05091.1 phosphatidyltransferase [Sphaerotilus sp. FB-5]